MLKPDKKNKFKLFKASLRDKDGKVSHTKISSYIILLGIYISSLVFLMVDIVNAGITWSKGETYEIPGAHIGIFILLLAHHLALLGIKKYSETRIGVTANENGKKLPKIPKIDFGEDEPEEGSN